MTHDPAPAVEARAIAFTLPPPRRGGRWGAAGVGITVVGWIAVWGSALVSQAGLPVPHVAVALLSFLPFAAGLLAAWAFLLWTLVPDRPAAAALVVGSALPALVWWGPGWAPQPAEVEGPSLRVATWNVRRLWGRPEAERPSLACVAEELRSLEPDVVALQEVTARDLAALDEALGLDCAWGTYRASDDPAGDAGLAVCGREGSTRLLSGAAAAYDASEDWRYVAAEVEHEGRRLKVLGVHLRPWRVLDRGVEALPDAAERLPAVVAAHRRQVAALLVAASTAPTVLLGDFNATPDTPAHVALRDRFVDVWTRGLNGTGATVDLLGWIPLRIDYVYVTPDVAVQRSTTRPAACSDHRPVVTDLRLPIPPLP